MDNYEFKKKLEKIEKCVSLAAEEKDIKRIDCLVQTAHDIIKELITDAIPKIKF